MPSAAGADPSVVDVVKRGRCIVTASAAAPDGRDLRLVRIQLALANDPDAQTTETARRRANHMVAGLSVALAMIAAYDLALVAAFAH